ncbi:30S ribosomal protein S9 [Corynebacterium phocae]|uniref:Small ribosomal subunit protein uS9 n=1 Tax=Corynebacterium phocae TaxID=161895 RepID=A0A1L7D4Y0_9CORY|nr:30S ribosomal protein S9 [Corynebacterium phocae]APT93204.1 30S ribosomal protein S9 [Corynebacterium phocae]KAA8721942.1 30S ribosomal protein S9 [Corynebacterium phocae]
MAEQNIDNSAAQASADAADIAAATTATEEFTNTIGDAIASSAEETQEVSEAPAIHEGPIQTVGRRKQAVARVRMVPGSGEIVVNGRTFDNYFPNKLHQQDILLPLTLLEREGQFDIKVTVNGGGPTGQAGALRLAIARALNVYNPGDRDALKKAGLLTRDARAVERKKAGLHKARRAPQFSKR